MFCFFIFTDLPAQTPPTPKNFPVACDCNDAVKLVLSKSLIYGETIAPEGPGKISEIKPSGKNPKYTFEKEHHSAWYKLIIKTDGNLSFDIIPAKGDDDYDFMLFRSYSDSSLCDSITKHLVAPVRANISRDKKEIRGWTGLRSNVEKELIREGVGEAYSKSIEVKKGQVYYLVLDNVYEKGMGHTISFYFDRVVELSGIIADDDGKPLKAEIIISDPKGDELLKTYSDEGTGSYKIKTRLVDGRNYSMVMYKDSMFLDTKVITSKSKPAVLQNIKTVLPRLKKGSKYRITSINFFGGEDIDLPASLPSIIALYKLMSRNSGLKIQIEGHTNGCAKPRNPMERGSQQLSEDRARKIKDYLVEKGIESIRVQTIGFGCTKMLYKVNGTLWEQEQNRRVEINVLEF
ncbi:MAG: OmpA family protein [Bacteroidia bacterium]